MASNDGKNIKIYKNPERNRPTDLKPYIPQYQLMGVEPEEYHSPLSPGFKSKASQPNLLPKDNPRARRPLMRQQPYAEAAPSPVGRGKGLLPNVGNNMEQTWSSVDGEIIDDLTQEIVDPNQVMIDNNDFVSTEALGLPPDDVMEVNEEELEAPVQSWSEEDKKAVEALRYNMQKSAEFKNKDNMMKATDLQNQGPKKNFLTENELQNALKDEYLSGIIKALEEDDYLLVVDGSAICSGSMEDIQEQARALVFGEHPLCQGNPMPVDDIVVLKRAKIKVGLFLE